jgi:D-amino-acid oxidase
MQRIAIIGAGVAGLTCGVTFAERGHRTTIFAREVGRQTTSSVAAAIWFPYDAEPAERVIAWSLESYRILRELVAISGTGVSLVELRCFARAGELPIPEWAHSLGAKRLHTNDVFTSGYKVEVPVIDTSIYLDYLTRRYSAAGGELLHGAALRDFADVPAEFEVVVNCSGLGARQLAGDAELEPHRGQVVVVEKFAMPFAAVCDDPPLMYAIPRTNDCVLGGTNTISDNCTPDPADTELILREVELALGCSLPPIREVRVGLRPYRKSGIRLARTSAADHRPLIHNYGHGGSGFTVAWGCAGAVLALLNGRD